MFRTTLKGINAHKRRLFGTGMAVVLGVAFLAGTLVLGDTLRAGFGDAPTAPTKQRGVGAARLPAAYGRPESASFV